MLETMSRKLFKPPTNSLDFDYIMGIFNNIQDEITPVKDYSFLMFAHGMNSTINIVGSKIGKYNESKLLGFDL